MSSILSVNNFGFNDYSLKSENAKKEKNNEQTENTKEKQIITIQEGKFYAKYLVDDDGNKILLFKVPVKEENVEDLGIFKNKRFEQHSKILDEFNKNIRNAYDEIKDKKDEIKDMLKLIVY